MEIRITSRHTKTADGLKETITRKLARLDKFHDKITSCHVVTDSESVAKVVEIVVNCLNHTVTGVAKEENIGKALDEAISKVERQIKKVNTKIKEHKGIEKGVIQAAA
jgi:putative sigma-54 modulation protein